jgi:hypothetical protein
MPIAFGLSQAGLTAAIRFSGTGGGLGTASGAATCGVGSAAAVWRSTPGFGHRVSIEPVVNSGFALEAVSTAVELT